MTLADEYTNSTSTGNRATLGSTSRTYICTVNCANLTFFTANGKQYSPVPIAVQCTGETRVRHPILTRCLNYLKLPRTAPPHSCYSHISRHVLGPPWKCTSCENWNSLRRFLFSVFCICLLTQLMKQIPKMAKKKSAELGDQLEVTTLKYNIIACVALLTGVDFFKLFTDLFWIYSQFFWGHFFKINFLH